MPRTQGARSADYETRRSELVLRLRTRLGRVQAMRASWRELASACDVSLSTLAHYFGKREDVVIAVLEEDLRTGAKPLALLATAKPRFSASIEAAVDQLAYGLEQGGLGDICTVGLLEGLRNPVIGPAFLQFVVESVIQSLEIRLKTHIEQLSMRACDTRIAAFNLLSPILMRHIHQQELGGKKDFPIPSKTFLREHARNFVQVYRS